MVEPLADDAAVLATAVALYEPLGYLRLNFRTYEACPFDPVTELACRELPLGSLMVKVTLAPDTGVPPEVTSEVTVTDWFCV